MCRPRTAGRANALAMSRQGSRTPSSVVAETFPRPLVGSIASLGGSTRPRSDAIRPTHAPAQNPQSFSPNYDPRLGPRRTGPRAQEVAACLPTVAALARAALVVAHRSGVACASGERDEVLAETSEEQADEAGVRRCGASERGSRRRAARAPIGGECPGRVERSAHEPRHRRHEAGCRATLAVASMEYEERGGPVARGRGVQQAGARRRATNASRRRPRRRARRPRA